MHKWLRDVVLMPALIAFVFMLWGAWYAGVKLHAPFSWAWVTLALAPRIPLWAALILVLLAFVLPRLSFNRYRKPRIDVFWHMGNCYWFKVPRYPNTVFYNLDGMFTVRNCPDGLSIIRASLIGNAAGDSLSEPLYWESDRPERHTFDIMSRPADVEDGGTIFAILTLVDNLNREYMLTAVRLRHGENPHEEPLLRVL